MPLTATAAGRPSFEIVPGVTFPDWAAGTSGAVTEALTAFMDAFGSEDKWSGLGGDEDRVRRAALSEYVATGVAPTPDRLADVTGIGRGELRRLLEKLEGRDFLVLDGETIAGAYPFTCRITEHRVHLGGKVLNAMCAIDALGAGAMAGEAAAVHSSCRHCGRPVDIETREGGTEIASSTPAGAVVWSGIQATNGCSADTMCTLMAFFCSDACLDTWRPGKAGYRLSMEEGLQLGMAIFMPLLRSNSLDCSRTLK
jgi:hypothetical protein